MELNTVDSVVLPSTTEEEEDEQLNVICAAIATLLHDTKADLCDKRNYFNIYKTFYKIAPAYEYSIQHGLMPMFAYDKKTRSNKGEKEFIVASYASFWDAYCSVQPEERCFYETIVPYYPCHLHIDAEYQRALNPNVDEQWLVATFKTELTNYLMERFSNIITEETHVKYNTLDASSDEKFSNHYILPIKEGHYMWKNNYHCGNFMQNFMKLIVSKYGPPESNPFFITSTIKKTEKNPETGEETTTREKRIVFFCDLAIYTLRRQFRIYGSTKRKGGYRPLLLEGEDKKKRDINKSTLFETLIQKIPFPEDTHYLECFGEGGAEPLSTSKRTLYATGSKQANKRYNPTEHPYYNKFNNSGNLEDAKKWREENNMVTIDSRDVIIPLGANPSRINYQTAKRSGDGAKQYYTDPEPAGISRVVTDFISQMWGGCNLKFVYYHASNQKMYFDCSDSKDCRVKGGEHTNNHIIFNVYLKKMSFVQSCYSPYAPCWRGYGLPNNCTEPIYFPPNIQEKIKEYLSDYNRAHGIEDSGISELNDSPSTKHKQLSSNLFNKKMGINNNNNVTTTTTKAKSEKESIFVSFTKQLSVIFSKKSNIS